MKFYGTMMCPDTVYADKILRENGIIVEYIDIVANMINMKEFLKLRDERSEFIPVREGNMIGVPVFLLDDGRIEFDVHALDGIKTTRPSDDKDFKGCSIDFGC